MRLSRCAILSALALRAHHRTGPEKGPDAGRLGQMEIDQLPALSNDGKWAAYTLVPLVGDGELVIRSTSGSTEYRVPRGYLGRPNNTPGGLRGAAGGGPKKVAPPGRPWRRRRSPPTAATSS